MENYVLIYFITLQFIYLYFYHHYEKRNIYIAGFLTIFTGLALIYQEPENMFNTMFGLITAFVGILTIFSKNLKGI